MAAKEKRVFLKRGEGNSRYDKGGLAQLRADALQKGTATNNAEVSQAARRRRELLVNDLRALEPPPGQPPDRVGFKTESTWVGRVSAVVARHRSTFKWPPGPVPIRRSARPWSANGSLLRTCQ